MSDHRARRAALACLMLAACAGEPPESDGIATWALTPELTIGGADEGPGSFSDVRGLAVDALGRVYVLEAQEQEVRLFDADGAFVRSLGRNGDGPGEFRGANGIAVDGSDRLWVYDPRGRRVTVFDSAGRLAETHAVTIQSYGYIWDGGVDTAGRLYDRQSIRVDTTFTPYIRRTDFASGTADTLAMPACEAASIPAYEFHSDRGDGYMSVPFAPRQYIRYDPSGHAWCADSRTISVGEYRLGDTIPVRTLEALAVPDTVTSAERDSAIAEVLEWGKSIGRGEPDFGLIPDTKPVLEAVDRDDSGRVWVRAMTNEGPQVFVFDSAGRHVAIAPFIEGVSEWIPLTIRGDRMYAVAVDSFDVPVVLRLRVGASSAR